MVVRMPIRLVLSQEVKRYVRVNRKPKESLHALIIGRKKGNIWYADKIIELPINGVIYGYSTVCPMNSKPIRVVQRTLDKGEFVLGLIHSHPGQENIPSVNDRNKAPVNKIHIIIGDDGHSIWYKYNNYLVEMVRK